MRIYKRVSIEFKRITTSYKLSVANSAPKTEHFMNVYKVWKRVAMRVAKFQTKLFGNSSHG